MVRLLFNKISQWYFSKGALPYWIILILDCIIVLTSAVFVRALRVGIDQNIGSLISVLDTWCIYLVFFLIGFRIMRSYSGVIRYSSIVDLGRVAAANILALIMVSIVRKVFKCELIQGGIIWQEVFFAVLVSIVLMWCMRICVKYIHDCFFVKDGAKRVFIYGVQQGGIALARSIALHKSDFKVVGFISDEPSNAGHLLMGKTIFYNNAGIVDEMKKKNVDILMVSPLKTETLRDNKEMIDNVINAGIKIHMYNQPEEWDGKSVLSHNNLKEVDIEDLLPRNQIKVDLNAIENELTGRCILITGAAGSIGSEIVRQVAKFKPSQLILVDQAETPLHDIRLMMARNFPDIPAETITASIDHRCHMECIFSQYKPEYVFHAAAYKHVPMMENNPGEAIMNNVDGTRICADLAVRYGASKFVMVSTDKAVNPTNVMGCSKRICEMYCQSLDKAIKEGKVQGRTQFVTTIFGNVLGSNGSVIPLFREQIRRGGPVTVTHPDIIRFFMLIPEACNLVLEAGTMGHGGEIFVFDMGKPVKIVDLAKRMISLSGANDVEIKFTGLRNGEKLYEEVLNEEETTKPSANPKIKIASVREVEYDEVNAAIDDMVKTTLEGYSDMEIVRKMKGLVPEFKSKHSKYEALD